MRRWANLKTVWTCAVRSMAGVIALSAGGLALGNTINCDGAGGAGSGAGQIGAVPYTIGAPGVYCLTQKISSNLASGAAITINTNNVVLDLNGFAIGNLASGPSTSAIGIYAVDRQNIVIQNGVLRGFWAAIALLNGNFAVLGGTTANSSGHTIQGITSDTSYVVGIVVQGPYASVRGNTVVNTSGTTVASALVAGVTSPDGGNGIVLIASSGSEVSGNSVIDTDCSNPSCVSPAKARGVYILSSQGTRVSGNVLSNGALPTAASSFAISVEASNSGIASTEALLYDNTMINWGSGIEFEAASSGPPPVPASSGIFESNQALGVTSAYTNGGTNVPGGGANISY